MSDEIETTEEPNWLKELEAKRERRLKARLGHEAGAGAPCLNCEQKCPGLDLHFWRKICKNCKCSKEDHDVHDDDIYGWAQFQLLGSKPNKIKRKIVLPGKKDEVELEWSPKGQKETVDKFLKTLPPELLPVKGSQAAQDRKQMLQKQIPIHDIDPALCHELTDSELKQMNEYIAHMKQNSVGVGKIVQIGFFKSSMHTVGPKDGTLLMERYPKGIPASELVTLQAQSSANLLNKKLSGLSLNNKNNDTFPKDQRQNFIPNASVYSENQIPANMSEIRDLNMPVYTGVPQGCKLVRPSPERKNLHDAGLGNQNLLEESILNSQNPSGMRNIMYPTGELTQNQLFKQSMVENIDPTKLVPSNLPNVNFKPSESHQSAFVPHMKTCKYPYYNDDTLSSINDENSRIRDESLGNYGPTTHKNLPAYNPNAKNIIEASQNPVSNVLRSEMYPQYVSNENTINANKSIADEEKLLKNLQKQDKTLPHYAPGKLNTYKDAQNPVKIGNFKDLAFSTYDPEKIRTEDLHYLSDDNKNKFEPQTPLNSYYDDQTPIKTILKQKYGDFNQNKLSDDNDLNTIGSHGKPLPHLNPSSLHIVESKQDPRKVNVGSINDVIYQMPEIKTAANEQNPIHQRFIAPDPRKTSSDLDTLPACHRCKKMFKQDEFAVQIEQNNSLFHPSCLKCAGCSQILADMFYFYDKKSDELYCLRDYAKIRGIPRCKACDELIFVKEYTLAENSTFHVKHFCCFECDEPLAGKNYIMEDSQPVCVPCYERLKANRCKACGNIIKPDEQGANLNGIHFHASDACFSCKVCKKPLLGAKLMFKNETLYCSPDCFRSDQM